MLGIGLGLVFSVAKAVLRGGGPTGDAARRDRRGGRGPVGTVVFRPRRAGSVLSRIGGSSPMSVLVLGYLIGQLGGDLRSPAGSGASKEASSARSRSPASRSSRPSPPASSATRSRSGCRRCSAAPRPRATQDARARAHHMICAPARANTTPCPPRPGAGRWRIASGSSQPRVRHSSSSLMSGRRLGLPEVTGWRW